MGKRRTTERASTTLEHVLLTSAVLVLLGGAAMAMGGAGDGLGGTVAARIGAAIRGGGDGGGSASARAGTDAAIADVEVTPSAFVAKVLRSNARGWRDATEWRWQAGTNAPRVSRDDIRMTPIVPSAGVWRDERGAGYGEPGDAARGRVDIETCVLCMEAGWRRGWRTGANASSTRDPGAGLGAEVDAEARIALITTEIVAKMSQRTFWGGATLQGRLRGTIGAEADGRGALQLGRTAQEVDLRGGAMVGAAAKGEVRAGVDLLGVAVSQTGRAEGWAGAGLRGRITGKREGATISWGAGGGAALGLGGAADWSGSIDLSRLPKRHGDAAANALQSSVLAVVPGGTTSAITIASILRGREDD